LLEGLDTVAGILDVPIKAGPIVEPIRSVRISEDSVRGSSFGILAEEKITK
jgi:hypothetical protein